MIQSMQFSNLNFRKINSAFIITLPVFKQALTQAVLLKRQKIQAQAMQALDDRTNEMLLKNARNTAEQTKLTAQLASSSSIKVETLEKTWQTIVNGIEETRRIQEDASAKRIADAAKLDALKQDFQAPGACVNGFPSVMRRDHTFEDICAIEKECKQCQSIFQKDKKWI